MSVQHHERKATAIDLSDPEVAALIEDCRSGRPQRVKRGLEEPPEKAKRHYHHWPPGTAEAVKRHEYQRDYYQRHREQLLERYRKARERRRKQL
jgi:hypothetical protein